MLSSLLLPNVLLADTVRILDGARLSAFELTGARIDGSCITMDPATTAKVTAPDGAPEGKQYLKSVVISPVIETEAFDQCVVSWNAECPAGGWMDIHARARRDGAWTGWYCLGRWTLDETAVRRTSIGGQNDGEGKVDTDTLKLKNLSDAAQVRVDMYAPDAAASPRLRRVICDFANARLRSPEPEPLKSVWGTTLAVPEISQLSYPPKGNVWCSATSVTMVMNYWAQTQNRPDWKTDVRATAAGVNDETWGGTGNWIFNTAFAGARTGLTGFCVRLRSFREVEDWISRGVPVVLSMSLNLLHGKPQDNDGHLIVCVGFDHEGNPVVNDPYAELEKGERVQRVYERDKLRNAWITARSLGTAYLIFPEGWKAADKSADQPAAKN